MASGTVPVCCKPRGTRTARGVGLPDSSPVVASREPGRQVTVVPKVGMGYPDAANWACQYATPTVAPGRSRVGREGRRRLHQRHNAGAAAAIARRRLSRRSGWLIATAHGCGPQRRRCRCVHHPRDKTLMHRPSTIRSKVARNNQLRVVRSVIAIALGRLLPMVAREPDALVVESMVCTAPSDTT